MRIAGIGLFLVTFMVTFWAIRAPGSTEVAPRDAEPGPRAGEGATARVEPNNGRIRSMEEKKRIPRTVAHVARRPYPAESLERLVVGRTGEQILDLLGEPVRTESDKDGDRWVYSNLTTNSEVTALQFRRDGKRVTVATVYYQLATQFD